MHTHQMKNISLRKSKYAQLIIAKISVCLQNKYVHLLKTLLKLKSRKRIDWLKRNSRLIWWRIILRRKCIRMMLLISSRILNLLLIYLIILVGIIPRWCLLRIKDKLFKKISYRLDRLIIRLVFINLNLKIKFIFLLFLILLANNWFILNI